MGLFDKDYRFPEQPANLLQRIQAAGRARTLANEGAAPAINRAGMMGSRGSGPSTGTAGETAAGGMMGGMESMLLAGLLKGLLGNNEAPVAQAEPLELTPGKVYEAPEPPPFTSADYVDQRLFRRI